MPPRKALNNKLLPKHNQPLPTLQLNDKDEDFPQSFQHLLHTQSVQEARYCDPYQELPHSRKYFVETTTQPTHASSSQQLQSHLYQIAAPSSSSPPFHRPSYSIADPTLYSQQSQNPQQSQNHLYQIAAPNSFSPPFHRPSYSQQSQNPSYQITAPNETSQQSQNPSYQIAAPNSSSPPFHRPSYSQQSQNPSYQIAAPNETFEPQTNKCKWDRDEDIALCDIGSNVSDRPKQQRYGGFWKIITNEYNIRMKDHPNGYRDSKSCQNRWDRIRKVAIGWRAAMERVRDENRSGFNELDTINQAKFYFDTNPLNTEKFKHDHLIKHLENFSKYSWTTTDGAFKTFDDNGEFPTTQFGSSQESAKRASPFEEDDGIEGNVEVSSPNKNKGKRPPGAKKQKAQTKAAREIFEEKNKVNENLSEARVIEAKAALLRAEIANKRANLKERRMDEQYLKDRFARAKTDEQIEAANELEKKLNEKWGL